MLTFNGITTSLGHFGRLAYALDVDATEEAISFWKNQGIQLVKSSDILFIRSLRKRCESDGLVPSERFLEFLRRERDRIASIHVRMPQTTSGRFASSMYQDGLLHALDDVLASSFLG